MHNSHNKSRLNQTCNCTSTSGYSSQTSSECDSAPSLTNKQISALNVNNLKPCIRTSTPSNLQSTTLSTIGSSLSTISTKSNSSSSSKFSFISYLFQFFLNLFNCFKSKKQTPTTIDLTPKINKSSFIYASTPIKPPPNQFNSFLYIDEKETYDNLPINSIESSQNSFNKAKHTVNAFTISSNVSSNTQPLLSSSKKTILISNGSSLDETNYDNDLNAICCTGTSETSSSLTQTPLSLSSSLVSSNSNSFQMTNNYYLSIINLNPSRTNRLIRQAPIYDDYLCDKEVESYFDNPVYFDCYNPIKLTKPLKCSNTNYLYLNRQNSKSSSVSTSSGIVSASNLSTLSSIRSIQSNALMPSIRQIKGESYC